MESLIFENRANVLMRQFKYIIQKQEEIKGITGEAFNVFSILNMERLEVRTHSAFIFELLDPKGSHCQGDLFLKAFIDEILDVEDFNYENVLVERERNIGEFGRLDLVIENNDDLIIIEMKIDADDQESQLIRYNTYAKRSGKEYKIYYLTLFGDDADSESAREGELRVDYVCLSFKKDIYVWIDGCIRKGRVPMLSGIRETLYQYIRLLEKITNKVDRGIFMEIKDILLKDGNLEVLEKITEVIPYVKAELEFEFWHKLYNTYNKSIEEMGIEFIDDGEFPHDKEATISTIIELRKSKGNGYWLEYVIGQYKEYGVELYIGNSGYDERIYISIGVINKENCTIGYKEYDKELVQAFINLGFNKSSKTNKYRYLNYDLNFYNKIYKLTSGIVMDEAIEHVGKEIMEIMKKINSSIELQNLMLNR